MSALIDPATVQDLLSELRRASPALARACEHVGSALRGSYVQLAYAMESGNVSRVGDLVERIRESDVVVGLAGKLHHLREQATELMDKMLPFFQTVFGLTLVVAGAMLIGQSVLLATLLMLGGFLIAYTGLPMQMAESVIRR